MNFDLINKRVHLYLGLFLIAFFLKYAVSSVLFAHNFGLNDFYKDKPQWTTRFERTYERPVPEDADLRLLAAQIIEDVGLKKRSISVFRVKKERLNINTYGFFSRTRLSYFIDQKRILAEDKIFRWDHFIHKFHWIGGYAQDRFIADLWAFMIDLTCVAIIIWTLSGIYIWWKIQETRRWGTVALGGGVISFLIFVFIL